MNDISPSNSNESSQRLWDDDLLLGNGAPLYTALLEDSDPFVCLLDLKAARYRLEFYSKISEETVRRCVGKTAEEAAEILFSIRAMDRPVDSTVIVPVLPPELPDSNIAPIKDGDFEIFDEGSEDADADADLADGAPPDKK